MDISEIRRHNARLLSQQCDSLKVFAQRLERSPAQIAHWIGKNPTRSIGPKVSRVIEEAFDKPRGWLDIWHLDAGDGAVLSDSIGESLSSIQSQAAGGNARAHRLANMIVEHWQNGLISDSELEKVEKMMGVMLGFDDFKGEGESSDTVKK